jgi:hypothetical protein
VYARESSKAFADALTFGTGAVMIPDDGTDPYHVPLSQLAYRLVNPPLIIDENLPGAG